MTQKRIQILTLMCAAGILVSSCAKPETESRQYKSTEVKFEPKLQDARLKSGTGFVIDIPSENVATERVYAFALDLRALGQSLQNPSLIDSSTEWRKSLVQSSLIAHAIPVQDLPFIDAAAGTTVQDTTTVVDGFSDVLHTQQDLILTYLKETRLQIPANVPSLKMLAQLKLYLKDLKTFLATPAIDPTVREEMETELDAQTRDQLGPAEKILARLDNSKDLASTLDIAEDLARQFEVKLDRATKSNLAFGRKLDKKLKEANTSEEILSVAVDIWEFYSPQEREEIIKPFSAELYDFFSGMTPDTLDCYALRKSCGFMTSIEKYFAEMQVEQQGVEGIRVKIRTAVTDGAMNVIRMKVRAELLKIPNGLIATQVKAQFGKFRGKLDGIITGYRSLVTQIVTNWSNQHLATKDFPGIEAESIQITAGDNPPPPVDTKDFKFSADSFALGIQSRALFLKDQGIAAKTQRKVYFDLINRLMAAGGVKDDKGRVNGSLALRLSAQNPLKESVDITSLGSDTSYVAIPDSLRLVPIDDKAATGKNPRVFGHELSLADAKVSVSSQAQLLKAWSSAIRELSDWNKTRFENLMAGYKVKNYLPAQFQVGDMKGELFQKEQMFALAMANALRLVMNFSTPDSPLFVINANGEFSFDSKEFESSTNPSQKLVMMAGLVDMNRDATGKLVRGDLVYTEGLVEMMFALTDFLDATKDIEKTQSKDLLAQMAQITKARADLKSLVVGLANFLSNKLLGEDGLVAESYSLSTQMVQKSSGGSLKAQIAALRGFLLADRLTGIKLFKQNALVTLYGLNHSYFSADVGFYVNTVQGRPTAPHWTEIPGILIALKEATSITDGESLVQLKQIIDSVSEELLKIKAGSE